jgi:hypothetical protein
VRVNESPVRRRRADGENHNAERKADGEDRQRGLSDRGRPEPAHNQQPQRGGPERQAEQRMRGDLDEIPEGWIGERPQVRRIEQERDEARKKQMCGFCVHGEP